MADQCPDELLAIIFSYLSSSHRDLNNVSLVCKNWRRVEALNRHSVKVRNCFTVAPTRLIRRFTELKFVTLIGQPDVDDRDFNLDLGKNDFWIESLAASCSGLKGMKLKRMKVDDQMLKSISVSFPALESLVLVRCGNLSNDGLVAIATNCRCLRDLIMKEIEIELRSAPWLNSFPLSCTSLESISIITRGQGTVDLDGLGVLVSLCRKLTSLRLSMSVPLTALQKIMEVAPQLVHLGIGSVDLLPGPAQSERLKNTIKSNSTVTCISGLWNSQCIQLVHSLCASLTFLDFTGTKWDRLGWSPCSFIGSCRNLQRLWMPETVGDSVLKRVAANCKELRELKLSSGRALAGRHFVQSVTEKGLLALSSGCLKLFSLTYVCRRMTNDALVKVAKRIPNLMIFKLRLRDSKSTDHKTSQTFDEGIAYVVQHCTKLKKLSFRNASVTEDVFYHISLFAAELEKLSVTYYETSSEGVLCVLGLCPNLRQMTITESPFGDQDLQECARFFGKLQYLWISSCNVTVGCCRFLKSRNLRLSLNIMDTRGGCDLQLTDDSMKISNLLVYGVVDWLWP